MGDSSSLLVQCCLLQHVLAHYHDNRWLVPNQRLRLRFSAVACLWRSGNHSAFQPARRPHLVWLVFPTIGGRGSYEAPQQRTAGVGSCKAEEENSGEKVSWAVTVAMRYI